VVEEFDAFDGATISTFVPVLVTKAARARLTRNVTFARAITNTGLTR